VQSERAAGHHARRADAINRQAQSFSPGEQTPGAIRQQMATTDGHQQALEQLATLSSFSARSSC